MHAQRVASKTTSLTRFADLPLVPKHELMLRCHYALVDTSVGLMARTTTKSLSSSTSLPVGEPTQLRRC